MTIFVFGNPDLDFDSIPLLILPQLEKLFPNIIFEHRDPNEEWEVPENVLVLDTVVGIKEVKYFPDIEKFVSAPRLSMHDFDALANLRFLKKLGKIKTVSVIGVPSDISELEATKGVGEVIKTLVKNN